MYDLPESPGRRERYVSSDRDVNKFSNIQHLRTSRSLFMTLSRPLRKAESSSRGSILESFEFHCRGHARVFQTTEVTPLHRSYT